MKDTLINSDLSISSLKDVSIKDFNFDKLEFIVFFAVIILCLI